MKRFISVTFGAVAILLCLSPYSFAGDMVALKWKFPPGAKYTYDLSQSMTMKMDAKAEDKVPDLGGTKISAGGPVVITCNNGGATVKIDSSATEATIAGHEMNPDQVNAQIHPVEMSMDADGRLKQDRYSYSAGNMQLSLDMLFPLPPKSLDMQKPVTQDMVVFTSGRISDLKGKAIYALKGIRDIDGISCADYHVSCKLKTAPDKKSKEKFLNAVVSLDGEFDCVFAIENGIFISVDGTEVVKMVADLNLKNNPFKDKAVKDNPAIKGNSFKMNMVMNYKTSLALKSAEYNQTPDAQQDTQEGTQTRDTQASQEDTQNAQDTQEDAQ